MRTAMFGCAASAARRALLEASSQVGTPDEGLHVEAAHRQSRAARADCESFRTSTHKSEGRLFPMLGLARPDQLIKRGVVAGCKGSLDRQCGAWLRSGSTFRTAQRQSQHQEEQRKAAAHEGTLMGTGDHMNSWQWRHAHTDVDYPLKDLSPLMCREQHRDSPSRSGA
jgi:hypothetical protein